MALFGKKKPNEPAAAPLLRTELPGRVEWRDTSGRLLVVDWESGDAMNLVAGTEYYAAASKLLVSTYKSDATGDHVITVDLTREPKNPHDPNAIRVDFEGVTVGYLPGGAAAMRAAEFDAFGPGVRFRCSARIEMNGKDPWVRTFLPKKKYSPT